MNKELNAFRLSFVRLRDHYKTQAEYIEKAISVGRITVGNAVKYNEEAKTLRRVSNDINDVLYPID